MNRLQKEMQDCSSVVHVTALDLQEMAKTEPAAQQYVSTNVALFRIVYRVGKLQVVGYVSAPRTGKKLPCLIHLRGGGGEYSRLQPKGLIMHLVRFSHKGYVVIAPQYPGVEGGDGFDDYGGTDSLKSITVLRNILKGLSVADHSCIGMKGHSRGGLMIYMMLRQVSWVKAAMIAATPTDQIRQGKERPGWRAHQIKRWGRSRAESIKRSPLRWAEELPKKTPLLIMQGASDCRVDPRDSIEMGHALYMHKIPYRFILFEGADHGITEYRSEYVRQTIEWFDRFLKEKEPLPNMEMHGN